MSERIFNIALDGTGGDRIDPMAIARAVRFATLINQKLKVTVFGTADLERALLSEKLPKGSYEFIEANELIPQDEDPRKVLTAYKNSAMRMAVEYVKAGKAHAVVSSGGTGPLVCLSRHILGVVDGLRPALCAKIPAGPDSYSLMLDLGANASSSPHDLCSFAKLGHVAFKVLFKKEHPLVGILNVGTERNKGSALVKEARDLIEEDKSIGECRFVEANMLFTGHCDVIVTDGFTGNVALKAAEGVASSFLKRSGIKGFFAKLGRPDWLVPWQYNGSILLGVNGLVVKGHGSAGQEAVAVALSQTASMIAGDLSNKICQELA
ncbi:MAG: phosphate acyltransferase [Succinivibrio sp.]